MYFNFKTLCLLLSTFLIVNCAGENQKLNQIGSRSPISKTEGDANKLCLTQMPIVVNKYFAGEIKTPELEYFWDCSNKMINLFIKYSVSPDGSGYTPDAVNKFLAEFFLEKSLPQPLMVELMKVKQLFLAGSDQYLSKEELSRLVQLMGQLKKLSLEMIEVVTGKNKSPEQFDKKMIVLSEFFTYLGQLVATNVEKSKVSDYTFESLRNLIRYYSNSTEILSYVNLIAEAKKLLLNNDNDSLKKEEWPLFLKTVGISADAYLRYANFLKPYPWDKELKLKQLSVINQRLDQIFFFSLQNYPQQKIPGDRFKNLFLEFGNANIVGFDLTGPEIASLWNLFLAKFLRTSFDTPIASELDVPKLRLLTGEFERWIQTQIILNKRGDLGSSDVAMVRLLNAPWPLNVDQYSRAILDNKQADYNNMSLMHLNVEKALITLIFRAYISEEGRWNKLVGLKTSELEVLFNELRPLIVRLGLIAETDTKFYENMMRESNLFLPRSNGDDLWSFEEAAEYIYTIYSGFNTSKMIAFKCGIKVGEDKKKYLPSDCFKHEITTNYKTYLSNMPHMVAYLDKSQNGNDFFNKITSVFVDSSKPLVPFGSAVKVSVFSHYIESIYQRYDTDSNEVIDEIEGKQAFEVFKRPLAIMLAKDLNSDEDFVEGFFTYLMHYHTTPFDAEAITKLRHQRWLVRPELWVYKTSRSDIADIMLQLASVTSSQ